MSDSIRAEGASKWMNPQGMKNEGMKGRAWWHRKEAMRRIGKKG